MPSFRARRAVLGLCATLLFLGLLLPPLGRGGAERSADDVDLSLPDTLRLQWSRALPAPQPAWPDQPKMTFDAAPRLAAHGGLVFVPSTVTDDITAFDAATGEARWRFPTDGPVRFAPVTWQDRLYLVSDDGYLYCLDSASGHLLWKFRGGPAERRVLGNGRLVSAWPARGAPVVADGTVYFAAGIWPFMGIFLHALDARTGAVLWTNDGDGSIYIKQPHQADSFAGVAPQGGLVVAGDRLLVPGGRSVPACYDRRTGKLLHYRLADNGKNGGGCDVFVGRGLFVNGGAAFDLANGDFVGTIGERALVSGDDLFAASGTELRSYDLRSLRIRTEELVDRKGKKTTQRTWVARRSGAAVAGKVDVLLRVGSRLYAGRAGEVFAVELPLLPGQAKVTWRAAVEGHPLHLYAAADRLFVTTREGQIYCFGEEETEPAHVPVAPSPVPESPEAVARAEQILTTTGVRDGWGLVWGAGPLARELARASQLNLVVIDADPAKAQALREELTAAGLYGTRVAVLAVDPDAVELPPYFASLVVSEGPGAAGMDDFSNLVRNTWHALRPYSGVACLALAPERRAELAARDDLPSARVREAGPWTLLTREGPLPGAADWTHEHADAANTRVSRDRIVKAPLGLLWWGGPSNDAVLPRHGHGPQPQVLDGRLFIEGVDGLRALDIYTGRLLWETRLPGVGKAYDNLAHQPGANAGGGNYVSTREAIYVAHGNRCVRLDPATGRQLGAIPLPPLPRVRGTPTWDHVNVIDDYLIAGANPPPADPKAKPAAVSSSQFLVVMNRHTGQVLWHKEARAGFRHNGVCAGGGRLYAIDRPSADHAARLERRGKTAPKPRLVAFDLATGRELWFTEKDVFGTWLSYSTERDVLVESGRNARDTLSDEPKGMRAYRAKDGKAIWFQKEYVGPAMIHGDTVLKDRTACHLLTGAPLKREDPLTGQMIEWSWARTYGCNTPMASEHLLTFRSGAAGYYDLCRDGGTGNLGGFRSGCTNNLVVAGGVLCAADYTRTCTCSYQNQTSVAFIPVADGEQWAYFGSREVKGPVRRIGVNLGAPGNRKADDGTLWLEYPPVGGPSPKVAVKVEPPDVSWFRRHESQVNGAGRPWVAASGGRGVQTVTVPLAGDKVERAYTVRLTFLEPDRLAAGQRVFDVALQGQLVLDDFDVCREAGGPNRAVVKEFHGVRIAGELTVTLTPSEEGHRPILSGIEAVAEGW